ncbi:zinc-dependent metalloprotease [Jonesia quinghaiensis]|uniref:zinc-dependent metalloprotease n=1 Tax=Jonesia quinghaiensis TaxID=262806 RepID=UPI0004914A21|nr:zinc-dependent metalloprotease [Jonesia quinghaiensis]
MTARNPSQEWMKSAQLAARIVRPGPQVSPAKAQEVVDVLRSSAALAADLVPELAHLPVPQGTLSRVSVLDRRGWTLAAARSMDELLELSHSTPIDGKPDPTDVTSGVEVMATLTFLSQRILGQFDPFGPAIGPETTTPATGNLVLVAPNVLATQRSMAVDLDDFALWVAIHEQTHALQFAHAPWLVDYMKDNARALINGFSSETSLIQWVRAVANVLRGGQSVFEAVLDDQQHQTLESVLAMMALLEGYADTVMDAVTDDQIASVRSLRRRFDARRSDLTRRQEIIGRLLGANLKSDQYRLGAGFVRDVISAAGHDTMNRVWTGPQYLPSRVELHNPADWIQRIENLD